MKCHVAAVWDCQVCEPGALVALRGLQNDPRSQASWRAAAYSKYALGITRGKDERTPGCFSEKRGEGRMFRKKSLFISTGPWVRMQAIALRDTCFVFQRLKAVAH